ncbi:MAG TPA: sensor histidine kinase, partial [Acetobacteraceae bacterium]|nr:sensor histidine kinase [Acetobacteraceae bacterium]
RLRNNLSVVASLLRLQARQVSDPTARQALEAAGDRVRTLALVQQDLQEAARGPGPVLGEFAWRIVERHIAGSEELADRIAVRWAGDDFRLAPEQVMPVGLIVNEWTALTLRGPLANCVEGSIHIRVRADEAGAMLLWADNGENRSADEPHALSRAILDGLVLQIGGELRGAEAGLRWRLFVPRTAA